MPRVLCNIVLDLILLENQIPFFVLEELFNLTVPTFFKLRSLFFFFFYLSLNFFKSYYNLEEKPKCEPIMHFTDLILILYQPRTKRLLQLREIFESIPSSMELNEVGVTFKASSRKCLFDIDFSNGVLSIPSFVLDDGTEVVIRNLMAIELCHYPTDIFVIYYIIFMDCLINIIGDVDLLVHKKIINNCIGDNKAAADLFNNLCINVVVDDVNFYFFEDCIALNAYYKSSQIFLFWSTPWRKLKEMLKRDYFHTPWKTASTIAAIMLLVLTFIQTVFSIHN